MQQSRAKVQLQYHQTLNRIVEMQLLAEQLMKLADSYRKEEQGKQTLHEEEIPYSGGKAESPGEALQVQARELRSAAEEWYRHAREEYRITLQEIRTDEERNKAW